MAYKFIYNEKSFNDDVNNYSTRYHQKYERFYNSIYEGYDLKAKAKLHAIYHFVLNLTNQSRKERGCFKKDIHRQFVMSKDKRIP